jgi:uncharacterized membrane protein YdjX (TVP38/TMEM64 family)
MSDRGVAIMPVAETEMNKLHATALWRRFLPAAIIVAGLAFGYAMGWHRYLSLDYLTQSREMLNGFVAGNPVLSAAAFMIVYTLAVAFSFPAASILTIFAGFLFGWVAAGTMVAFSATAGATIIFIAARSAFGDFLRDKVSGKVKALAEGFEKDAFGYLLVLRLAPVFPFFLMNIAPALFKVPLRSYVAATFVGILPGTFAYTYLGSGIGSVIDAAAASGREATIADVVTPQITLSFALLAVIAAIPTIVRRVRERN